MNFPFIPSPEDLAWIPYPPTPSMPPEDGHWEIDFTIVLGERDSDTPALTASEIGQMEALGFRFSLIDRITGEFRLTLPFATRYRPDAGTLTFLQ